MKSFKDFVEELFDRRLAAAPIEEMASLHPKGTGLDYVVWFGRVRGQHGPRIKVSNTRGRFNSDDCFVVSVEKTPKVLTPRAVRIPSVDLEDVLDWVSINYDLLMEMWHMYETGDGNPTEILVQLQKI